MKECEGGFDARVESQSFFCTYNERTMNVQIILLPMIVDPPPWGLLEGQVKEGGLKLQGSVLKFVGQFFLRFKVVS